VAIAVKLIASGDISDYTPAVRAAIAQDFAIAVGVPLDSVHVDVEAASVAISVTIVLPSSTVASDEYVQVQSTFKRLLRTPRDATQFLSSVANGSINVIRIAEGPQVFAPPSPANRPIANLDSALKQESISSNSSLPIAIGASLGGLCLVLVAIFIYIRIRKAHWKRRVGSLLEARVEGGLIEDGGLRRRDMRSVSFVAHNARPTGVEMKLAPPRKEVLSDHI